uniref:DWNN domain-containing protein n=1 Tax=Erpetoichthys calabaricus TaxID=27687 RepID=A0A8C4XCU1_ERPCA
MSAVHYKFASSLVHSTVTFTGLGISVAELREEIMKKQGLTSAHSVLVIINAETNEEYIDDAAQIPRNSSVIVRRIPGSGFKGAHNTHFLLRNWVGTKTCTYCGSPGPTLPTPALRQIIVMCQLISTMLQN